MSKKIKVIATIELDSRQKGIKLGDRGKLYLYDGQICCLLPNGDVEETGVISSPDNAKESIRHVWDYYAWDLRFTDGD